MLILTRKAGDAIVVDGGLRITLLSMDGQSARIGIEAPQHVRIMRAEIVDQVAQETRRAASPANLAAIARISRPPHGGISGGEQLPAMED